jgi:hypothetical protein
LRGREYEPQAISTRAGHTVRGRVSDPYYPVLCHSRARLPREESRVFALGIPQTILSNLVPAPFLTPYL